MSLIKYIERLQRMDALISMRATGSPDEFAQKLSMRRSTLFQHIQELKEMGVEIKYSYICQSYYYADGRRIRIEFEQQEEGNAEYVEKEREKRKRVPLYKRRLNSARYH